MKKFLLIIVILVLPFISMAQTTTNTVEDTNTIIETEVAIKTVEPISINPKTQNLDLNYKKSNDLISIKAYIKSLQLKRKETLMS
ncbi:hypothetical protein EB822_11270 [Flavobacteriaceae bacterium PRS1]|nr:hypothetical protein EB822_11270 [Flavobacteriaceae bacterium PRS1]